MFKTIKEFFEATLSASTGQDQSATVHSLELAAAVLMVEISLADSSIQAEEQELIKQNLQSAFQLSGEEAGSLLELAEKEVDHAVSLHDFTSLLNEKLSANEKIKIVELLWQVAFADAVVDKYEEYFVRKIADLLYVSHSDYIKAKHNASV